MNRDRGRSLSGYILTVAAVTGRDPAAPADRVPQWDDGKTRFRLSQAPAVQTLPGGWGFSVDSRREEKRRGDM